MVWTTDINSGGYRRDLVMVLLAYGLLYVSDDIEKNGLKNYEGLVAKDTLVYPDGYKEMLATEVERMKDELFAFLAIEQHRPHVASIKAKSGKMLNTAMTKLLHQTISLDVVAMYLLFNTFCKREKPLHKNFEWLSDRTRYELIVDTYDAAGFSLMTKIKMDRLSRDIFDVVRR